VRGRRRGWRSEEVQVGSEGVGKLEIK
jgi:hypothetical protein